MPHLDSQNLSGNKYSDSQLTYVSYYTQYLFEWTSYMCNHIILNNNPCHSWYHIEAKAINLIKQLGFYKRLKPS